MAVDWLEQAAQYNVREVALQVSKTSDQVFSAVLAAIPAQPAGSVIATGKDTYTYALDDVARGDHPTAAAIFQRIAQSELGFIFIKGDLAQGGTLVFENRQTRAVGSGSAATFNDDMVMLVVPRSLDQLVNRVEMTSPSRKIDAAATTVLYVIQTPTVTSIAANGGSITIWGNYRDPNLQTSLVGGTAMVVPVATTDYTMNALADGTGADLTATFTVTATYFGASVKFVITNNGASDGFITKLQCRGKGLYDYAPETSVSDNASSQTTYGLRAIKLDMPYQTDRNIAQSAADYLAYLYGSPLTVASEIGFQSTVSQAFTTAALAREISDRISVDETVTGITAATGTRWFINAVDITVSPTATGPLLLCKWTLAPADTASYWILDDAVSSLLDVSTRPGYV